MKRITEWYGAGPLHLLVMLASFAIAGYAAMRWVTFDPAKVLVWFVGSIIAHDLILFPIYALADRSLLSVVRHRRGDADLQRPWINHVRVPVLLSGLLLLVSFPLVFRLSNAYQDATGRQPDFYLGRWLAISAALFLGSAVVYAVRLRLWDRGAREEASSV